MNDRTEHHPDDRNRDQNDDQNRDQNDVMALLRTANPDVTDSTARTNPGPEALFEEILMTDTQTPLRSVAADAVDSDGDIRTTSSPRRRWQLPAAVAAAAIVATTTFAVWPDSGQTAEAAVRAAAASTESAASGTIKVLVDYSEEGERGSIQFVSRFFGDDSDVVITYDDDSGIEVPETEFRLVGDRFYTRGLFGGPTTDAEAWFETDVVQRDEFVSGLGLEGAFSASGADGLVELLERATDIERRGDDTFTATITVGDARQLAEVPAGLSFLTDETSGLDDDQVVDVEAHIGNDGRLHALVVDVDERDSGTDSTARIEVTYSDLDGGEPITAPTDAQTMPDLSSQLPAELDEPVRIITEYIEANPDSCPDVTEPTEIVQCLRSIGENEVADAMEVLADYIGDQP